MKIVGNEEDGSMNASAQPRLMIRKISGVLFNALGKTLRSKNFPQ